MPKHGDACFLGGFVAQNLETTAKNHDPQHVPYEIQLISSLASGSATELTLQEEPYVTEQPSIPFPRVLLQGLPASGSATEQILPEKE